MKKFLVVLLSLGLIVGFSATASAVDVSFSGSYQVEGAYEDNVYQSGSDSKGFFGGVTSRAAVWQRFRLQPVFKIAEGLTMTVRFDALEKQWGNTAWRGGTTEDYTNSRRMPGSAVTATTGNKAKIQENIEFERSYVSFLTGIGKFDVGYQRQRRFGTDFHDYEQTGPRFAYFAKAGPAVTLAFIWDHFYDADMGVMDAVSNRSDGDIDGYNLAAIYNGKGLEAGFLWNYTVSNYMRGPAGGAGPYRTKLHAFDPYVKATFGPVYLEAEAVYVFGAAKEFETETAANKNVTTEAYGAYAKVRTNIGPAYIGASAGFSSGDDLSDATKNKNRVNAKNWNPTLILLGDDYLTDIFPGGNAYDAGNFSSWKNSAGGFMIYNVFGGFNPTPKLNLEVGFTSASFDKAPKVGTVDYVSKNMGMELDVTATYKIYDNLTYMIAAGYLFTGDAFKGTNSAATIGNDYMLMNRLALSF